MIGKEVLRVLMIDDSMDDVVLIARELNISYSLIWDRVETEAALIIALNETWDVILCDYKMPHLSPARALELVRVIHNIRTPFILISGAVENGEVLETLKMGANDFIEKDKIRRLTLVIQREMHYAKELRSERLRTDIRVKESYEQTIEAWGKALELRDFYTEGHTVRATDLSLRLALHLNLPRHEFVNLNRGALLHDIGKMGIPDAILLKQEPLTFEEMEIMRKHPEIARDMLKGIPFLEDAIAIPYCHHERWNGSGYPQGLMGSDNEWSIHNPDGRGIPRLARLFAIVDIYDALTTDRPYRQSWEKPRAIAYLLEESGKTLDPEIVEAFVEMIGRA